MNGEFVHAAAENCQGQVELLFEGEVDKKERLEGGIRTKCSRNLNFSVDVWSGLYVNNFMDGMNLDSIPTLMLIPIPHQYLGSVTEVKRSLGSQSLEASTPS